MEEVQKEQEALREETKKQQEKRGKRSTPEDLAKNLSPLCDPPRVEIRGGEDDDLCRK